MASITEFTSNTENFLLKQPVCEIEKFVDEPIYIGVVYIFCLLSDKKLL